VSYIKPGGRTWIKTELNDLPLQTIYDEIEDRIWEELFPKGLPKTGEWTFVKHHKDWCQDDTCPGRVASTNELGWSLHRDGGGRSTTT
jgi:hypothetical protein